MRPISPIDQMTRLLNASTDDVLTWRQGHPCAQWVCKLDRRSISDAGVYNGLHGEVASFLTLIRSLCQVPPMLDAAIELCQETLGRLNRYEAMCGADRRLEIESAHEFVLALKQTFEAQRDHIEFLAAS